MQIKLYTENQEFYADVLDGVSIPLPFGLNENLQHLEQQVAIRLAYDSSLHKFLVENSKIYAELSENSQNLFTGIVDTEISWTDDGEPEPISAITVTIYDNTQKLKISSDAGLAYIGESLAQIIVSIATLCNIPIASQILPQETVPAFVLQPGTEILQPFNDLLFQYGYAFGFDESGMLIVQSISNITESETIFSDFLTGLKFTKTKKNYEKINLTYGKLIQKENEQVYFEGGDLNENNEVVPIIVTPGSYYPHESNPQIEEEEGQVYQEFSEGFAESYTLYNGEKKYRRSKQTELVYTTNHYLIEDWAENLVIDRTEFESMRASVRLHNTSKTDAELKQLAIRATAYYRQPAELILGQAGKAFEYESLYIYDDMQARSFSQFLSKYFLGGNYKITGRTETPLLPGEKIKINTGLSGVETSVVVLTCQKDWNSNLYTIEFLTEQNVTLDEKRYQRKNSMTAEQRIQRTEYDVRGIKTVKQQYYVSTSRTELLGGEWLETPPVIGEGKYLWTKTITSYSDGSIEETSPISISGEKGEDGKNAIVMKSPTTPNGEYDGQIGIYQGHLYKWVVGDITAEWVLTSGTLPTDPVLHYSFDELPDLPDGTSILALKNGKTYDIINNWATNGTILKENINGNMRITSQDINSGVFFGATSAKANDVVKIKVKTIAGTINILGIEGYNTISNRDSGEYVFPIDDSHKVFICYGKKGTVFEIEELYIGDASYATPVIDNTRNNHNTTTTKGFSVQGISGKGLQLTGNNYVDFISHLDFSKQLDYSCSCWIKDWDNTTTLYVMNNWRYYAVSPNSFRIVKTDIGVDLRFDVLFATDATKVKRYTYSVTDLENNSFVTLTVTKSGVAKLYINGKQLTNYTTTEGVVVQNSNIIQIGRSMGSSGYNYSKATLDDFMLFDRALSDQEVLGLYLARGNTPKNYTLADYRLDQGINKQYIGTEIPELLDYEVNYPLTTATLGIKSLNQKIYKGDTYLHPRTQDLWECTTEGTAQTSKWTWRKRLISDKENNNVFRLFTPTTPYARVLAGHSISVEQAKTIFSPVEYYNGTEKIDMLSCYRKAGEGALYSCVNPYNKNIKVNVNYTYRFTCFIKQNASILTSYLGLRGHNAAYHNDILVGYTGNSVTAAYFNSGRYVSNWHLVVGYVYAWNYSNNTSDQYKDSGVYTITNNKEPMKTGTCSAYRWVKKEDKDNAIFNITGMLINYVASDSSTNATTTNIFGLRFDKCDGNEIPLKDIMNGFKLTEPKYVGVCKTDFYFNSNIIPIGNVNYTLTIGDYFYYSGNYTEDDEGEGHKPGYIYEYTGNGKFNLVNTSKKGQTYYMAALQDILAEEATTNTGFFSTVFANSFFSNQASINALQTKTITLTGEVGIIKSEDYIQNTSGWRIQNKNNETERVDADFNGNTHIGGDLTVDGEATFGANCLFGGEIISGPLSLKNETVTGVTYKYTSGETRLERSFVIDNVDGKYYDANTTINFNRLEQSSEMTDPYYGTYYYVRNFYTTAGVLVYSESKSISKFGYYPFTKNLEYTLGNGTVWDKVFILTGLPTVEPNKIGAVWNDNGTLKIKV